MTDKELRKLRRVELLELLVDQAAEMEELRRQLDQANEALAQRKIQLEEAGSIAEAALRLNGVFEAADKAAQEYLDSAREMAQKREALLRRTQEDAEQMARELLSRTREECRKLGGRDPGNSARPCWSGRHSPTSPGRMPHEEAQNHPAHPGTAPG